MIHALVKIAHTLDTMTHTLDSMTHTLDAVTHTLVTMTHILTDYFCHVWQRKTTVFPKLVLFCVHFIKLHKYTGNLQGRILLVWTAVR